MATADQLLELIFSWIEQKERCAEQLRKLAGELDSLREKPESFWYLVGACMIGALVAPAFFSKAAAPFLDVQKCLNVSVVTEITERFISSDTMKEAQSIEKNSDDIGETIQRLFQKLKAEKKEVSSSIDPDELDQHVMTEVLRAMVRRSGLNLQISVSVPGDDEVPTYMKSNQSFFKPELMVQLAGILTFFTFQAGGKIFKPLFAKGAEQLIKQMSTTGFETTLKGGGMVVGGAVGMAFALAINKWKKMITENHVTEASQSLRDTADVILKMTRTLRKQIDDIKEMFDEMSKCQQEQEEHSDHEDEREGAQTESTRWEQERESDQNEQTGSREQGGGDQGDEESDSEEEESDQGDEDCDSEEEESDQGDEDSDSEEEESDQGDEESDSEEDESKQSGRKQTRKRIKTRVQDSRVDQKQKSDRSFKKENNLKFETNQRPPGAIRSGLLNVRSLNKINKKSDRRVKEEIKELITQNHLDVFLTTETWLKREGGDEDLKEASPPDFKFYHQAREGGGGGGGGGGVAIQVSQVLQGEKKEAERPPATFEYVAAELQHDEWHQPVLLINVYRPPGDLYSLTKFCRFLDEFQSLLDEISENYNSIIVTGDFNIWVDNNEMRSTIEFQNLLERNNLVQHVEEATHQDGHTLDLIITRNVEISDLTVQNDGISDHYTVYFIARPVTKDAKEKTKEKDDEEEKAKESEL